MPGVLILEGLAQTGGVLLLDGSGPPGRKARHVHAINNAKFRKPFTRRSLIYEVTMMYRKAKVCR